ncbi:MAG TPA: 2-hydroxyacyl-CoA dehydratase family protein [Myxococcota bacterium]|nr:2-hydroxyacyl-CoA dehydratase family protein [Myxococcota bacterium]
MSESSGEIAVPGRIETIRAYKALGGKVAAVFPIHYPRALFRACDILPVEVWGPPGVDTCLGDAHLQAYTCPIVRAGLSFLLQGKLDLVDMIVVPHACDSLQGLGSILLDFIKPARPVLPFYVPRGEGEPARQFLVAEISRVRDELCEIGCKSPTPEEISEALAREERADAALAELLARTANLPTSDRAFYRLVRSREYLPAEEFEKAARALLVRKTEKARPGIPVLLSGIVPEPGEIFDAIASASGRVAGDDLCCSGRRLYAPGHGNDPLSRMADGLLSGPPDSTRGSSVEERIAHLSALVERHAAKGIIFYNLKFCEPELFYLPQLRQGLQAAGVRSVVIESDLGERLSDQTVTRIEAFLESVA